MISQIGMALSFVGTRFSAEQLTRPGSSLHVTVNLPDGPIAAVVSIVYSERPGSSGRAGWLVGATISQMSDRDVNRLAGYIKKRSETEHYLALE